jgi:hypothetical protein
MKEPDMYDICMKYAACLPPVLPSPLTSMTARHPPGLRILAASLKMAWVAACVYHHGLISKQWGQQI